MISVVTYLWTPDEGSKFSAYRADDVRLLQRMVARHMSIEHQFIVVTDRPELFTDDDAIRAVPIDWTTHVPGTCFVRLFTFSPKAKEILGERILQLDLDAVIVGSLDDIADRSEDLVLWRNPRKWALTFPEVGYAKALAWFNGSMLLLRAGSWVCIWRNFDSDRPYAKDDQWLVSDYAGKDNPYWSQEHGVYRLAPVSRRHLGVFGELPDNAKVVFFPGTAAKKFMNSELVRNPWIERYRI